MNEFEEKVVGVLEALDECGNVILGDDPRIPLAGNPHATISQRMGQEETMGTPAQQQEAKIGDEILTFIEKDVFGITPTVSHCLDSLVGMPESLPKTG